MATAKDRERDEDDQPLGKLMRDGLFAISQEIAKSQGEINGRLKVLENEVHSLTIRVAPVLKAFENDLTTRIALLEKGLKEQEEKTKNITARAWGLAVTSLLALIGALWSLIEMKLQ
jgi:hypothetical protein